ncbi:MAG: hypothetical protein LBM76_01720 [Mycoplasmataceae bacterium]|nr:hypothetical protein [Mycoplasmataceae bacterium]
MIQINDGIRPFYFSTTSNFFDKYSTAPNKDGKVIVVDKSNIYWIKSISLEDFATLDFVMENFFDDSSYCHKVLCDYFYNKGHAIYETH